MPANFDYKINQSINFQLSVNGSYLIHINRFSWTDGPITESKCTIVRRKSYKVSPASYARIATLCRVWAYKGLGQFDVWTNSIGWEYKDYGNPIKETGNGTN